MKLATAILSLTLLPTASIAAPPTPESDPAQTSDPARAIRTVRIEGRLRERGTRKPLADTNVFILPHKLKTTTDAEGRFAFEAVPEGPFEFVVNRAGYIKLQLADAQSAESFSPLRELYLEAQAYAIYETTVVGKQDRRDNARKSLKASEFATLPGAGGDPVKAVQNLPGVNRARSFNSSVIIQGSSPRDTRYLIDGQEVPIIFHFGGLSSVVLPEALERVDYSSAGFGAEYGRTTSGLVGVWTRKPREDRLHGMGFVDIFNAGGYLEGPTDDQGSSFLIGARQSYIGTVLRAAFKNNKEFNLTVAPQYQDFVGIYDTRLSPRDDFRLDVVGSRDTLEFLLKQPVDLDPSLRGNFRNETSFFRLIPQLTHRHGENWTSRWSLGLGRDWIHFDAADNYFALATWSLTARGELEKRFSEQWTAQWGFDNRYTWANVNILVPDTYSEGGIFNPFSTGELKQASIHQTYKNVGIFWRNEVKPEGTRLTLIPSLRGEHFSSTGETLALPRLASRYALTESLTLTQGSGLYAQSPTEQEVDPTFGNPQLRASRAVHLTLGAEKDFREGGTQGFVLAPGVFYKNFERLVVPSTRTLQTAAGLQAERYSNEGTGRAYGLESQLRLTGKPWSGWLTYTLSRSTRTRPSSGTALFEYDQTHNVNVIGQFDAGSNWQLSARGRYTSGNPVTPVTGSNFDADNDVYVPMRGPYFSRRLGAFFQLDLRVDKKWIYDTWILSAYLDIQNLTNRRNIEQINYSYDYSTTAEVTGLPILPTLGVKAEF